MSECVEILQKERLSRLLYVNPVCVLSVGNGRAFNHMVITWLTCYDNKGGFMCSMNQKRHSAEFFSEQPKHFVLGVAAADMEALVLAIGGCSGRDGSKEAKLGLHACCPGWGRDESAGTLDPASESQSPAKMLHLSAKATQRLQLNTRLRTLRACVAHIVCRMDERVPRDDHWIMFCHIEHAYVRPEYWTGSGLVAAPSVPPLLTFLGSQKFAYMCGMAPSSTTAPVATAAAAAESSVANTAAGTVATAGVSDNCMCDDGPSEANFEEDEE